jgi:aminopeptidase N
MTEGRRSDPHSYYRTDQPAIESLDWQARVDFDTQTLTATVVLQLSRPVEGALDLDTRALTLFEVTDGEGRAVPYVLHPEEPVLGARLELRPEHPTRVVRLRYQTAPTASALQWLLPSQTAGQRQPFLFSQGQAIHARSFLPLQDTPEVRVRYTAELEVPSALTALMAARQLDSVIEGAVRRARFDMPQPIPPYLIAFAIGELASHELGPRSRVWAEPSVLPRAAWEYAEVDRLLTTAEQLLGPYDWERFDLLVMPPSFPYGGMENPRLTFLTPSLLAGDRSLVNVVAHELAHSWTGNLVTNANAEHFWLNEGFTVFAERRILEAVEGRELAELHAALGHLDLLQAFGRFAERPELTRLRTTLDGVDPDDAFSSVPYEKGYLFLRALEEAAGRPAFDRFLAHYLGTYRFRSVTTEDFLTVARQEIPAALVQVDFGAWLEGPGLPPLAPLPRSQRLEAVRAAIETRRPPDEAQVAGWSAAEWSLYLEGLEAPLDQALVDALEQRWHLSSSGNLELVVAWLEKRLLSHDRTAWPLVEKLLGTVGRMKYLRPLYGAWARSSEGRAQARALFESVADRYHPVARQMVRGLLDEGDARARSQA